jgi:hypothetical protein
MDCQAIEIYYSTNIDKQEDVEVGLRVYWFVILSGFQSHFVNRVLIKFN